MTDATKQGDKGMTSFDLKGPESDQQIHLAEDPAVNSLDSQQIDAAAEYFEQREKVWMKLGQGDIWIAIGIYLVIASIAFVAI